MTKVAAMEEMYLIYQTLSNYLAGTDWSGEFTLTELLAHWGDVLGVGLRGADGQG